MTVELIREISQASINQRDSIELINNRLKDLLTVIDEHSTVSKEIAEISKEIDMLAKSLKHQVTSIQI